MRQPYFGWEGMLRLSLLVGGEPAAGGELGRDAGGEQQEADGEGADDPAELHPALEHEPVEQGQDEDQHCCLGEEGGAAMGGDRDQVVERGGCLLRRTATGWNQNEAGGFERTAVDRLLQG